MRGCIQFYIFQKEEFSITNYKVKHIHKRQIHLLVREDVT
jgi:hypothetical protein